MGQRGGRGVEESLTQACVSPFRPKCIFALHLRVFHGDVTRKGIPQSLKHFVAFVNISKHEDCCAKNTKVEENS